MTPEQSSYLAQLAYCGGEGGKNFHTGQTIKQLLSGSAIANNPQTGFSRQEWAQFLEQIKGDPELMNMRIRSVEMNKADGGLMLTVVNDETREAAIVYQGTAGPAGWEEDFRSGYMATTESQDIALQYAEKRAAELKGYYITATGHSKGGNHAALASVEVDGIDRAYAFDAPGNSEAYFADSKHAKRSRDNAYKVHYYSNENCFVSAVNTRYKGSKEYWIKSTYSEWGGKSGTDGILSFAPLEHSMAYMYGKGMLNGKGGFIVNESNQASAHAKEINRFVRYLERTLPQKDLEYLLNALGGAVAVATSGGDLKEILGHLDQKSLGILLAALEDYPRTEELFESLMAEGWLDTAFEKLGITAADWVAKNPAIAALIGALGSQLMGLIALIGIWFGSDYLKTVFRYRDKCKARIRLRRAKKKAGSIAASNYSALFHTHDFTEEKLRLLERLVSSFKNTPLQAVYNVWQSIYGALPFFAPLNLSFANVAVGKALDLLNSGIDAILKAIQNKFNQAWEADSRATSLLIASKQQVDSSTAELAQLL